MTNAAFWINVGEVITILLFVFAGFGVIISIKNGNEESNKNIAKTIKESNSDITKDIIEFKDIVMELINDDKAAIRHMSDKIIKVETTCESCRISAVELEQRGMEHRLTAIETHYHNVAENIRLIRGILEKVDEKLGKMNDKVGALKGQIADAQDLAG